MGSCGFGIDAHGRCYTLTREKEAPVSEKEKVALTKLTSKGG